MATPVQKKKNPKIYTFSGYGLNACKIVTRLIQYKFTHLHGHFGLFTGTGSKQHRWYFLSHVQHINIHNPLLFDDDVVLQAPHTGWHSLHSHLLPFFVRTASGMTLPVILANLLAHDECNETPQPQHELISSAVPVGPLAAVPRHSIQMLDLLVYVLLEERNEKRNRNENRF